MKKTDIKPMPMQDTESVRTSLITSIKHLCKDGLKYERELNINGLLGITLDDNEVLLVNIREVIRNNDKFQLPSHREEKRRRKSAKVTKLKAAEINNTHHSDGESDGEYPYKPKHPRLQEESSGSSRRSSVDSMEAEDGVTNTSLSIPQVQRYVQNTELFFPETTATEKARDEAIVVQPTGDYEENAAISRPNSKGSLQSDSSTSLSQEQHNTQTDLSAATYPNSQSSDNQKLSKTKSLENALNKLNQRQQNNESSTPEYSDEPINLCSRSASRNEVEEPQVPQDFTLKKEPDDKKLEAEENKPMTPPVVPFFGGALPKGEEMASLCLHNMAANQQAAMQLGAMNHMMLGPRSPLLMPNHLDGTNSPLPLPPLDPSQLPQLSDPTKLPLLPPINNPYVLNTPKLPQYPTSLDNAETSRKSQPRRRKSASQPDAPAACSQGSPSPPGSSSSTSSSASSGTVCNNCGTNKTSTWRRCLSGSLVCNACGLYYKLHQSPPASTTPSSGGNRSKSQQQSSGGQSCSNCGTGQTTMWRRNMEGEPVCNACGLYYKLHQVNRPKSMVKSEIHSRRRKPRSNNSSATNGRTPEHNQNSMPQETPRMAPHLHTDSPGVSSISAPGTPMMLPTPVMASPLTPNNAMAPVTPNPPTPTTPNATVPSTNPGAMYPTNGPMTSSGSLNPTRVTLSGPETSKLYTPNGQTSEKPQSS